MKPSLLTICLIAFGAILAHGNDIARVEQKENFQSVWQGPGNSLQQPPPEKEMVSQDAPSDLEGTVEVAFRIASDGKVDILNINASNPKLIDYVVKKLGKIQLDDMNTQPGKVIKYRFVFKKQA